MRALRNSIVTCSLLLVGLTGCGERGLGPDTVARAADFRLGVDQAAQVLAPVAEFPEDPNVIEALADFWVDYILLALVVNEEGALEDLDLSAVTRQQLNQELVLLLRDEVIESDFSISDEELQEIYEEERPAEQVRARHVLLLFPDGATEAQRDSVRELAEDIRQRARAGSDFAAMAEEYSADEGSAARGGDLNFFSRGTMVPEFEEAAFSLEPGEVSEVVQTQYGLHVIKVEEREWPALEEIADQLRQELQMEREARAESIFVAGVEEPANIEVQHDAFELAREMANDPDARLRGRAAQRPLVTFEGGAYTAENYRWFLLGQPPQMRDQIAAATDEQLESMLRNLSRGEILVQEAERRGVTLPEGKVEELEEEIRNQYRMVAEQLGFLDITPQAGESMKEAVERTLRELLPRLVSGEQDVFPLSSLSLPLREQYRVQFSRENMERAAQRMGELRAAGIPEAEPEPRDDPGSDPDGGR